MEVPEKLVAPLALWTGQFGIRQWLRPQLQGPGGAGGVRRWSTAQRRHWRVDSAAAAGSPSHGGTAPRLDECRWDRACSQVEGLRGKGHKVNLTVADSAKARTDASSSSDHRITGEASCAGGPGPHHRAARKVHVESRRASRHWGETRRCYRRYGAAALPSSTARPAWRAFPGAHSPPARRDSGACAPTSRSFSRPVSTRPTLASSFGLLRPLRLCFELYTACSWSGWSTSRLAYRRYATSRGCPS